METGVLTPGAALCTALTTEELHLPTPQSYYVFNLPLLSNLTHNIQTV